MSANGVGHGSRGCTTGAVSGQPILSDSPRAGSVSGSVATGNGLGNSSPEERFTLEEAFRMVSELEQAQKRHTGMTAGRFSAFLPGWGHMSAPVLRCLDGHHPAVGTCVDGTCEL